MISYFIKMVGFIENRTKKWLNIKKKHINKEISVGNS